MGQHGNSVSIKKLYFLLQCCVAKKDLSAGRDLQGLIIHSGYQLNSFLGTHLIRMFALCGSLSEAKQVFTNLHEPTVFAWSSIILAHANLGQGEEGINLYHQMQQSKVKPNKYTLVAVLKACSSISSLDQGKLVHAQIVTMRCELNVFVGNSLIYMYAKFGSLKDARSLFDNLPKQNIVSWSTIISGYAQHECGDEALQLFWQMQKEGVEPNDINFVCTLKACSSIVSINEGKLIHHRIQHSGYASDLIVGNALVCMYAKCRSLEDARSVFNELPKQSVVTWNAMVTGYAQNGHCQEAVQLFWQMPRYGVEPNDVTFACVLKACSSMAALKEGTLIHAHIIGFGGDLDAFVGSTLIDLYINCASLEDARSMLDNLPMKDVVAWSTMIAGYAEHGHGPEAFSLFCQMQQEGTKPNDITYVCIMKACSNLGALDHGKLLHAHVIACSLDLDECLGNTILDMYVKCGTLQDASRIFVNLLKQSVVAWNAMILGNAQQGHDQEALQLFKQMQQENMEPSIATFLSILKVCCNITALEQGELVYGCIIEFGCESDLVLGNAVIDMYSKCNRIRESVIVFNNLLNRNVITWCSMISGCSLNSDYELALAYFDAMQQEGLKPNEAIFVCLLCVCSHLGLVHEGFHFFNSMEKDHGIFPTVDHYNCMVDLLGRVGRLSEAEDLLCMIPFKSNIMGWSSLLNHCKTYVNVVLGRQCFEHVVLRDYRHALGYVHMSNAYADAGMWEDVGKIEELKMVGHAWKKPGNAFVEVNNDVHDFFVGETSCQQNEDIYIIIERLCVNMKDQGYVPHLESVIQPFAIEKEG